MSIGKPQSSIRMIVYLTLALFILMASWDANRSTAAFNANAGDIPQNAIRLRILANSDTVSDQWIKHKIRDAIVDEMTQWVDGPQTIDEARAAIRAHLPELRDLANGLLAQYGYSYRATVELAVVPFPTKMYGDKVYPAGNYEALRVSLGKAEGENWWCVLFPPLCFVDAVTNEAVAKDDKQEAATASGQNGQNSATPAAASAAKSSGSNTASHGKDDRDKASITVAAAKGGTQTVAAPATAAEKQQEGKTQVKFFLWEMLKKLWAKLF